MLSLAVFGTWALGTVLWVHRPEEFSHFTYIFNSFGVWIYIGFLDDREWHVRGGNCKQFMITI